LTQGTAANGRGESDLLEVAEGALFICFDLRGSLFILFEVSIDGMWPNMDSAVSQFVGLISGDMYRMSKNEAGYLI